MMVLVGAVAVGRAQVSLAPQPAKAEDEDLRSKILDTRVLRELRSFRIQPPLPDAPSQCSKLVVSLPLPRHLQGQ